ncbi:MAG: hypothetical protein DRO43_00740 [Candidatus Hecatellales archaeon]|nr:MAG: hypothetical protein DRO43_00740 [Candidatus Hecatellales archaeon]
MHAESEAMGSRLTYLKMLALSIAEPAVKDYKAGLLKTWKPWLERRKRMADIRLVELWGRLERSCLLKRKS